MVRVSVKFVNFGNVKLGCTYVQTVQLRVSSADRYSGKAITLSQPRSTHAWIKLRDKVDVAGIRLRHTWEIDVFVVASDASALEDSFTVSLGHPELSSTLESQGTGACITVPIVANVVEKGAFERLYRESPKWVHGKGGRHTNATVRVVSSTLQDASAKQDIIIPAPALKAASKFGKTLVSVKDRLAADFFHPLPAFDTSLTSSGNRKESLGSRPDPSTLSVINPTPTHAMAPTRPESQARRHIAASPRTKASELRGASRPRAATTVSKYNMTDSVPTVGSNYQPSGSTSAGHLKPFRGAKVVAPRKSVHITDSEFGAQSPGGSTHSLGDLECQAPHADPTHAARLLSSSDEDEEDIPHEASTAVASRSERPPVGYTSRPTTGQTFDTDTPMLLTSLRDARHGDSADSTPQLTALAGEPAGSDAPCDATRVSSTFSQAASTARDMSRSDLLTPERWEKLIELVELCQRQVSVEEQAKVQAQLEVKRLQHTVHELSTKLQRFEVHGAAANAGSSTAQGPQSRDFNGEESAGVLAQVNTAKGCNIGSEVLEPLSASEQATFDAALRSQAKQDAYAPRTASRDAAAVTKELDEQGGESSDDDGTANSQDNSQWYRDPRVKRMLKSARLEALHAANDRASLKITFARWRFAGAAAVAVRWRHRHAKVSDELDRLRSEYSALCNYIRELGKSETPSVVKAASVAIPSDDQATVASEPAPERAAAVSSVPVSGDMRAHDVGHSNAHAVSGKLTIEPSTTDGVDGLAHTYVELLMQKESDIQEQQDEIHHLRLALAQSRDRYAAQDKMVRSLVYKLAQVDAASPGRDNTELAEATARFKAEIKSVAGAAATREQRALKQLAALRTARDQAEQSATVAQQMLQEVLRPRIIGGGGRSGTLGQLYRSKLTATHGAPVAPRAPARPGGATATLSSYSFPRRTLSSRYSLPSVSTDASSIVPVSDSKDGEAVPKSALMTLTSDVSAIAQ